MRYAGPGALVALIVLLCVAACALSCVPAGREGAETSAAASAMPAQEPAPTRRGITPSPEPAPGAEPTPTMTFRRAMRNAQLATVAVGTVPTGPGADETRCDTFGSGTIVDPQGLIVTNAHVLKEGELYCIACARRLGDSQPNWCYDARVIKRDEERDLALLLIESRPLGRPIDYLSLPAVPMGDAYWPHIGDTIYVLGYPSVGGASLTVTRGMIAGFEGGTLIKTDAEFSSGSSGGPAITENGLLIGIAVKVRVEDAGKLGYLVSANEVRRFIK